MGVCVEEQSWLGRESAQLTDPKTDLLLLLKVLRGSPGPTIGQAEVVRARTTPARVGRTLHARTLDWLRAHRVPLHLFGVPPRTSHAEFLEPSLAVPPVQARTQARFVRRSMH